MQKAHRADRPHRRRPEDAGRAALWNKLTDEEKKIFTDVTREAAARATAEIKKREAELVDVFKKKGLQIVTRSTARASRRRAEERAVRVDGLHEGRLRPDRRDQVTSRACATCHPREAGSSALMRSPATLGRIAGRRRPSTADQTHTTADDEPVLDDEGHFHAADAPIDISHYGSEDWLTLGVFWLMALGVFLQFFTRYVLQRLGRLDRGDRALLLIVMVFIGSAMCVRRNAHIQVDFLYRYMPAGAGRVLSTADRPHAHRVLRLRRKLVWRSG